MLPSKSITPFLGIRYGQTRHSQFFLSPDKQQLTKRKFYEHLRDPVHQHLQQRTTLLRVSSLVKALLDCSLNYLILLPLVLYCIITVLYLWLAQQKRKVAKLFFYHLLQTGASAALLA